jgi:HK97 family phage major capsid protein
MAHKEAQSEWRRYFSMQAKGEKTAEIDIYEQIGKDFWDNSGIGAKEFAKELKALGDVDKIILRLNSPGGSVFEGLAIYNLLVAHSAAKEVYVDGIAASIASVIAMAGKVIMPQNAIMMIHDPFGIVMGDASDMRKMADSLDKIKSSIISAYMTKTNISEQDVSDLMSDETWMNAEDALGWGFADEVIEPVKIAASFDLSRFKNAPKVEAEIKQEETLSDKTETVKNTNIQQKEVVKMALQCTNCGTPMVGDACPRCDIDNAAKAASKQARQSEIERAKNLRTLGKEYKAENLAEHAIQEGWNEDQLRAEILNRIKKASPSSGPVMTVTPNHDGKPFRNFGEQLRAIVNAANPKNRPDERLFQVYDAASGASESVSSDGGFLVQSDFTTELLTRANETMVLAPRCRKISVSGNGISAPIVDETTRATGSRWGGVQIYRADEAATVSSKKPKFAKLEMKLEKLMGIAYATEELLADATALEGVFSQAFTEEFGFKVDDEIVNGAGAGEMLGILNAPCLVSQTKETGQTAATIVAENIIKMYSRMPGRSKANAIWLINSECMPQIMQLNMTIGTAGVPLFMPPGGLSQQPYGTIFGKPVIEIEQCAALGTVGDILFVDLSQYLIIEKGGINASRSVEVKFVYDEMTFKWVTRNNGQPIWKSTLTPYKGSATVSPFVALASRT